MYINILIYICIYIHIKICIDDSNKRRLSGDKKNFESGSKRVSDFFTQSSSSSKKEDKEVFMDVCIFMYIYVRTYTYT
jgi:hypothetical protein